MMSQIQNKMKKSLIALISVHSLIVLSFTLYYLLRGGYEFMIYILVIVFFSWLVWHSMPRFKYSMALLWALAIWSWLHLSGGGIPVGDGVLYQWMIWPVFENYPILRFDQFVHTYGFGVTVFVTYTLLKHFTKTNPVDIGTKAMDKPNTYNHDKTKQKRSNSYIKVAALLKPINIKFIQN